MKIKSRKSIGITLCKYRISLRPHLTRGDPGHQCVGSVCSGHGSCDEQIYKEVRQ